MRTKTIKLRTGDIITLYENEETGEWVLNKRDALDAFHENVFNGTSKKARMIRKFYSSCTLPHTRKKIRCMVNEGKIDLLYQTILNLKG